MVGYHFCSLDKNGQIYEYGWNFNMAAIYYIFECFAITSYRSTMVGRHCKRCTSVP